MKQIKIKKQGNFLSYIIFLVFIFSLVSLTSAQNEETKDLVFKINTEINLIRPCYNNGTYCSLNTICNSTVVDPLGVIIVNNSRETNQGTIFNVTVPISNTGTSGVYSVSRSCRDPSGDIKGNGGETYTFLVTSSGVDDDSLSYLITIGFIFIFSIGIMVFGFWKQDAYMTLFGSIGLFLLGLFTLLNGIGNYVTSLTQGISIIVLGIAMYISSKIGLELINE